MQNREYNLRFSCANIDMGVQSIAYFTVNTRVCSVFSTNVVRVQTERFLDDKNISLCGEYILRLCRCQLRGKFVARVATRVDTKLYIES